MRVLVPLAEGFEEIEAVTIIDVLRRGGAEVTTTAIGRDKAVPGAHGITVVADQLWEEMTWETFDAIVLPGGGRGTENLGADQRVIEAVQTFDQQQKFVAAICAAPMVLARAGVLKQKRATCYPACADVLGESYDDAPVVADGHIITSQGPATALLFALVLVEHFMGEALSAQVASDMLVCEL